VNRQLEVIKQDSSGRPVWSYSGRLLQEAKNLRLLEAFFDREPVPLGLFSLEPGDRMLEYFYDDRWYNIFEIFDGQGRRKGWYCNVARPAEFKDGAIQQRDLALDLVVDRHGHSELLDEVEFEQLELEPKARQQGLAALSELERMVADRIKPFDSIHP
jgi:hypothetical protein